MIRKMLLAAAIALAGLALPNESMAETMFDGVYVDGCLPDVTCSAEIHPTAEGWYSFEWKATNRTGDKLYCSQSADLMLDDVTLPDGTILEGVPTGILEGTDIRVTVLDIEAGKLHIRSDDDGDPCPKSKTPGIKGWVVMNGMYYLEGDI
jgi:hypothetical protein